MIQVRRMERSNRGAVVARDPSHRLPFLNVEANRIEKVLPFGEKAVGANGRQILFGAYDSNARDDNGSYSHRENFYNVAATGSRMNVYHAIPQTQGTNSCLGYLPSGVKQNREYLLSEPPFQEPPPVTSASLAYSAPLATAKPPLKALGSVYSQSLRPLAA